jgi:hypothetical protein
MSLARMKDKHFSESKKVLDLYKHKRHLLADGKQD